MKLSLTFYFLFSNFITKTFANSIPPNVTLSQETNVSIGRAKIKYNDSSIKKRNLRNGKITTYQVEENACQYDSNLYKNFLKVAVSGKEWNNGQKCGTCIQISSRGTGTGITPFTGTHTGIITNICPECDENHFDLYMEGDGIWDVDYQYIACKQTNLDLPPVQYKLNNNNNYYISLQIINTGYEILSVQIYGHKLEKTFDNFWVSYEPQVIIQKETFEYPLEIVYVLSDGKITQATIYENYEYTYL